MAKPRGIFYGWIIVAAGVATTSTMTTVFFGYGLFINPLEAEFGWNRATTSSAFTFFVLGYALSAFLLGRLADRYGPRVVIALAGLLLGSGLILASLSENIWHLRLTLFLSGVGAGPCWSVPAATVSRWFVQRRGLALGLMTMGTGLGPLLFIPLTSYFIQSFSWRMAFQTTGLIYLVLTIAAALLLVHSPERKGLQPYGAREAAAPKTDLVDPPESELSFGQAVRTRAFVWIAVILMVLQIPIQIVMTQLVPFATGIGISATLAATAQGLVGGFRIPGTILMGAVCDRIGWKRGLALTHIAMGAIALFLLSVTGYSMLLAFVFPFAFFFGGRDPPQIGILGYFFGTRSLGSMIGLTQALSLMVGAGGPYLAGYLFDRTGSYNSTFLLVAFLFVLGGTLALRLKPPKPKPPQA